MNKMKVIDMRYSVFTVVLIVTIAMTSCQSETAWNEFASEPQAISFGAVVNDNVNLATRAIEEHPEDVLNRETMSSDPYGMDFFIELCCNTPASGEAADILNPGTYIIPSGYSGHFAVKETKKPLTWRDLKADHTFYGWNLPTSSDCYKEFTEEEKAQIKDYDDLAQPPLKILFHNSQKEDGYEKYKNNADFQYFVGTKVGPVSYETNGEYVELPFRHLVSKVIIDKMSMVEGPHSIQNNLKADMTIYGLPESATFYPHPKDDGWPVVEADETNEDKGLTFYIPNEPDHEIDNVFYICPEVDFSELTFEIKIVDENYVTYDSYWGNFENVEFKRTAGTNYDKGDGSDKTILHAGEEMHLVIALYQGEGPGISIVIEPWSTEEPNDAVHHSHPGVYTDGEAQDLISVFSQSNPSQDDINNLFDLYGESVVDEGTGEVKEKVFKLYENVTVSGSNFPIGEDYVLDGMGHTITMSSSSVTIGNMRDVYITDGTNTIYIDSDGNVCLYNPETYSYEKTEYKLNENSSTKINLTTGAVS